MRKFRNPYVAAILAVLVLFSSCAKQPAVNTDVVEFEQTLLSSDVDDVVNFFKNNSTFKSGNVDQAEALNQVDEFLISKGYDPKPLRAKVDEMEGNPEITHVISKMIDNGEMSEEQSAYVLDFITTIESNLSSSDITTIKENFVHSVKSSELSNSEKQQLVAFATIMESFVHVSDELNGDFKSTQGGLLCGIAIAGWGLSAAALVIASGGTAAVLIAGLSYSVATAGLAGCFV